MIIGNNRMEIFRNLEDKIDRRIQDWKCKMLSWAGREVLIKTCLESIPLYSMSCFKLPKTLCNQMSGSSLNFWWQGDNSARAIHWIRKELMQKGKLQCGLGFRCFESLNIAMLMKQTLENPYKAGTSYK